MFTNISQEKKQQFEEIKSVNKEFHFFSKSDYKSSRAADDRNLTVSLRKYFNQFLKHVDLSNILIFDFGAGAGELYLELAQMDPGKRPAVVVQFEFQRYVGHMNSIVLAKNHHDPFNKIGKNDCLLRINPEEYRVDIFADPEKNKGNFQYYNIPKLLNDLHKLGIDQFMIMGNPPYFLWNRILSLTNDVRYVGMLAITSMNRAYNHTGGVVVSIIPPEEFSPIPKGHQALVWQGKGAPKARQSFVSMPELHKGHIGTIPDTVEYPFYPLCWIAGVDTDFWKLSYLDYYQEFHGNNEVELFLTYIMLDHYQQQTIETTDPFIFYAHAKTSIKNMLADVDGLALITKLQQAGVRELVMVEYLNKIDICKDSMKLFTKSKSGLV